MQQPGQSRGGFTTVEDAELGPEQHSNHPDYKLWPEAGGGQAVAPLAYNGIAIRDRDGKLNLTDMWKAAGKDPARQPAEWLRSADAKRFKDFLAETLFLGDSQELVGTKTGPDGGTWAHWQLGLAYAKYLSPPFHAWGNQVIRDRMEGKIGRPEELATPAFDPNDPNQLRATLIGYTERVIALEGKVADRDRVIEEQAPKVAALHAIAADIDHVSYTEAWHILEFNKRDDFRDFLIRHKWAHPLGGVASPAGRALKKPKSWPMFSAAWLRGPTSVGLAPGPGNGV